MPKLVCASCEVELKIEKMGVKVVEMFNHPPQPYKIWDADLWKCPKCRKEIVAGFGQNALMEHFQDGFTDFLQRLKDSSATIIYDYER